MIRSRAPFPYNKRNGSFSTKVCDTISGWTEKRIKIKEKMKWSQLSRPQEGETATKQSDIDLASLIEQLQKSTELVKALSNLIKNSK